MSTGKSVLVTGASGFLGPYAMTSLQQAGWRVRAALRQPQTVAAAESVIVGSIDRHTGWTSALSGVDTVVHLAGLAHQSRRSGAEEERRYAEANTAATLRLADAAAGRARHFVFLSTILVNGPSTDGRAPFRETDPPDPQTPYARSKAAAEEGLLVIAAKSGLQVTIVRPPLIYGRRAKGNFALLARAVRAGLPLPLGAANNKRAFAAAENVASFVTHCAATPESCAGVFIVADERDVSSAEFVRLMADALGRRVYLPRVPGAVIERLSRLGGVGHVAQSLFGSLEVDRSRTAAIGWRPAVSMERALRRALRPEDGAA